MKFEHLIQINDPLNAQVEPLTCSQLWQGLVMRAQAPGLFIPHLDDCQISQATVDGMSRRLRYGELTVVDRITFIQQREVLCQVAAQADISESSLSMMIEEPQIGLLTLRFCYDDGHDAVTDAANALYDDFRRSAYFEADLETIRVIRDLARQGRLDALPG